MVLQIMAKRRPRTLKLALLLALILPLQGFAAAWHCGPAPAAPTAQQHCTHGSGSGAAQQHHGCSTSCCSFAIAVMPLRWAAPPSISPQVAMPLSGSQPSRILDRLDRPPRLVLG
jgi:hypothetical protein